MHCPAANGRDPLRALQNVPDGIALLIGQLLVLKLVFDRPERLEFPFSILNEINQPLFFRQHILGGEPLPTVHVFLNKLSACRSSSLSVTMEARS